MVPESLFRAVPFFDEHQDLFVIERISPRSHGSEKLSISAERFQSFWDLPDDLEVHDMNTAKRIALVAPWTLPLTTSEGRDLWFL
jgi:hypothetical protein